jgi:MFS family permease
MPGRTVPEERLLTPAFVLVTGAALVYFIAIGVLTPVLPVFVEDELGGGGTSVGIAVGAFAVSAALLRPLIGRIGDERGRRVLVVGGCAVAAASILGYLVATSLPVLVLFRLLTGVGEAAAFVGAATAAQDLAPRSRRGEATSYFSVAIYGGLGIGPVIGEVVRDRWSVGAAWVCAAVLCIAGAALGAAMPRGRPEPVERDPTVRRRLLQPDAIRPGVVLACSTSAFAGFSAFVPLYVDDVGLPGAAGVLGMYAAVVLAVRIFGARLPDRLGARRGVSAALILQGSGLLAMGALQTAAGLYASTVVYALGVSLLYPSLFPLVVDTAPERERSHAVATFTLFFDLSQGFGALLFGVIVAWTAEPGAFVAGGVMSFVGLALFKRGSG